MQAVHSGPVESPHDLLSAQRPEGTAYLRQELRRESPNETKVGVASTAIDPVATAQDEIERRRPIVCGPREKEVESAPGLAEVQEVIAGILVGTMADLFEVVGPVDQVPQLLVTLQP
jgi:hypothetical protein